MSQWLRQSALVVVVALLTVMPVYALSVDNFVLPVDGGTTEVAGPVTEVEEGVARAQSAQDAFNYANQALVKSGEGFWITEFPSGIGFIGAGTAFYQSFENENASYLSKRAAYVQAYTVAKGKLAEGLYGARTRSSDAVRRYVAAVDEGEAALANVANVTEEQIVSVVSGMLRGYVIYDVRDDTELGRVYVSVAISPKSVQAVQSLSEGVVAAGSLRDGIDYVLGKIESGVTPPAGATLVTVPQTGQTAVVGFGSALARHNENPMIANQLRQAAVRAAELRSHDAIISILQGDNIVWRTGMYEQTRDEASQFLPILDDEGNWLGDAEALETTRTRFVSFIEQTDDYTSIREGYLPPGIQSQTYWDGPWVYVVSLYLPDVTFHAGAFQDTMLAAPQASDEAAPKVVPSGPTGRVTDDSEL